MQIRPQEIDYRKDIGTLDGRPVIELGLKGGLHLVLTTNGPKIDYLGVGPHRAVARFMAKKRQPNIQFQELSKAEDAPVSTFQHLVPQYEAMLARLSALNPRK